MFDTNKILDLLALALLSSFPGRHSTPLHFAAGYNRVLLMFIYDWVIISNSHQVGVVEFLLNNGADVHAKDKVCG